MQFPKEYMYDQLRKLGNLMKIVWYELHEILSISKQTNKHPNKQTNKKQKQKPKQNKITTKNKTKQTNKTQKQKTKNKNKTKERRKNKRKTNGYPFCNKNVSVLLDFFLSVKPLIHAKLIIGRLPSFMFLRSFDSLLSVTRQKLAVNMVVPINFLDTLWKTDRSFIVAWNIIWRNSESKADRVLLTKCYRLP